MNKIIISLFIGSLLLIASPAHAGLFLRCESVPASNAEGPEKNLEEYNAMILGTMSANCKSAKGDPYAVAFDGFGPGLRIAESYFTVFCPTVSKKRMDQVGNRHTSLFGARIAASAVLGVNAGLVFNQRGGACILTGVEVGIGASMQVGFLEIARGTVKSNSFEDDL